MLFTPGVADLHVVLRVEVRARAVGRAARVHDGQRAVVPERLQRRHARMQAEEAVEIDAAPSLAAGSGDRDRRPQHGSTRRRRTARSCSARRPRRAGRSRSAACAARPRLPRSRARNDGAKPSVTIAMPLDLRKTRLVTMTSSRRYCFWNSARRRTASRRRLCRSAALLARPAHRAARLRDERHARS